MSFIETLPIIQVAVALAVPAVATYLGTKLAKRTNASGSSTGSRSNSDGLVFLEKPDGKREVFFLEAKTNTKASRAELSSFLKREKMTLDAIGRYKEFQDISVGSSSRTPDVVFVWNGKKVGVEVVNSSKVLTTKMVNNAKELGVDYLIYVPLSGKIDDSTKKRLVNENVRVVQEQPGGNIGAKIAETLRGQPLEV